MAYPPSLMPVCFCRGIAAEGDIHPDHDTVAAFSKRHWAALARLSQFAGIFSYFRFKMATKFNDCSEAISKRLR